MPYREEKRLFIDPLGEKIKLWRYMDFTKFVSLLQKKALFFPSIKTLRETDPWEGRWSQDSLKNLQDGHDEAARRYDFKSKNADISQIMKIATETRIDQFFISCWNYSDTELHNLWKVYSKSHESICIKSTVCGFQKSFQNYKKIVNCGKLWYLDYNEDLYDNSEIPQYAIITLAFLHKRKIFKDENEYRAIINIDKNDFVNYPMTEKGTYAQVDLDLLIEEIIVSPRCHDWFLDLVKDTVDKYGINKRVRRSIIDESPYTFELSSDKHIL